MARRTGKRYTDQQIQQFTYEQAYEHLQEIVQQIEQGQVGLEESVARYEDAMKMIAHCRRILQKAEQKVLQLQQDSEGRATLEPFQIPSESETRDQDSTGQVDNET
jgi:exodeoxyribonuclease VII small subunit